MLLDYAFYAKQVSAAKLQLEVVEKHIREIARELLNESWEGIAPHLGLSHAPHVLDAIALYPREHENQKYV